MLLPLLLLLLPTQAKIFNAKQALFEDMGIEDDDEVETEEGSGSGADEEESDGGAAGAAARETVESEDLGSERKRPPE